MIPYSLDDLRAALDCLKNGKILLYPTDTIWGLGCSALNLEAISKIGQIKKRPENKNYIVMVNDVAMLKNYIDHLEPKIENLLAYFEKPLTLIYKHPKNLPAELLAADGSIGIRVSRDSFCQALIKEFDAPIISTSANISGEAFPTHFGKISSAIIQSVDYIVKHRQNDRTQSQPSVLAKMNDEGELEIIR